MKLSSTLLQAITLGIAVSSMSSSCQKNEVNSGRTQEAKMKPSKKTESRGKEHKKGYSCPACGMG